MDTNVLIPEVREYLGKPRKMLINGTWSDAATGRRISSLNPATGQVIAEIPEGAAGDVDRAVAAARYAFEEGSWSKLTPEERGVLLWRLADLIEKREEEFSQIETLDNGAPQIFTRWIVRAAVSAFRYYAGYASKIYGIATDITNAAGSFHAYTRMEPVGVVGVITPWNGPLASMCGKVAPALAAGCTVIVKPAELTSLTALRFGELALEAGIPPGALNIVTGYGPVVGQAIVDHPGVDKISFTGSTAVGKHLARCCTGNLKRITLELGGKSPMIVFADADLEKAIPLAARAIFNNSGQVCFAGSRLFVEQPVYDKVVAGVAAIAQGLTLGDGFQSGTDLGPLISERQRARVLDYVESGVAEGAEIVTGGAAGDGDGFFVKPTVFAATRPEMKIFQEEIFGPVVAVQPFTEEADVIRRANATNYGLGSGICTENIARAHRVARQIKAGNVWINCYGVVSPRLPFGGYKESGWGREFGAEGIESCLEKKTVHVSA